MLSARLRLPICRALTNRAPLCPVRLRAPPTHQLIGPTIRSQRDLHVPPTAAMTADRSRSASLDGSAEWPCNAADLTAGRQFLQKAVEAGGRIVLAPDKDADGLSAGAFAAHPTAQLQHQPHGRGQRSRIGGTLMRSMHSWGPMLAGAAQAPSCWPLYSSWEPRTSSRISYQRWPRAATLSACTGICMQRHTQSVGQGCTAACPDPIACRNILLPGGQLLFSRTILRSTLLRNPPAGRKHSSGGGAR